MTGLKIKFNGVDRLYKEYSWRLTRRAKQVWATGNVLQGQYLEKFEKEIAKKYKRKYAVAVASATDGLYFALRCAGVTHNDTVVCPALSYVATSGAIKRTGAHIEYIDTDNRGNIDALKISNMSMPKALIYVNLYGNVAEYESLRKICSKRGTVLIEDAAQSQGSTYFKKQSGTLGDLSIFSFDPMKNMPSFGGGGAVLTDSEDYYKTLLSLRRHGFGTSLAYGYNSLLADDHANQLLFFLSRFDKLQKHRKQIFERYKNNLPQLAFIESDVRHTSSYHKCVIQVDKRDDLRRYLAENGVETKIHYEHTLDVKNSYPVAESICRRSLSLPIYPFMKRSEVDFVCNIIKKFYNV